jgi:hypothetical protein
LAPFGKQSVNEFQKSVAFVVLIGEADPHG